MAVPWSKAVACKMSAESIAKNEMGDLCAWMSFAAVRIRASKSGTSPESEAEAVEVVCRIWEAAERGMQGRRGLMGVIGPCCC